MPRLFPIGVLLCSLALPILVPLGAETNLRIEDLTLTPRVFAPQYASLEITFGTTRSGEATIRVFDEDGRLVALVAQQAAVAAGATAHFTWSGRDASGKIFPVGIYIVHVDLNRAVAAKESFALIK
jgi:hypothetical protein